MRMQQCRNEWEQPVAYHPCYSIGMWNQLLSLSRSKHRLLTQDSRSLRRKKSLSLLNDFLLLITRNQGCAGRSADFKAVLKSARKKAWFVLKTLLMFSLGVLFYLLFYPCFFHFLAYLWTLEGGGFIIYWALWRYTLRLSSRDEKSR